MVQSETHITVGKMLRERRYLLGATIDEMAQEVGIPSKHLRKIEKDAWASLPSAVYTQGFIKKYALALGMDAERVIEKYKKESKSSSAQIAKPNERTAYLEKAKRSISLIGSGVTRKVAAAVLFVGLLAYMAFQLSIVFAEPSLVVSDPFEEEIIIGENTYTISGATDTGALLTLNNEKLEVRPDGTFSKEIDLLPGINVLIVKAESRFGESSSVKRTVIYKEPQIPTVTEVVPEDSLETSTSTVFEERSASVGTTTENN